MLNSYSDPLVCTQETAAHLKRFRASQLRCAPGYHHNDITVLIIGNLNKNHIIIIMLPIKWNALYLSLELNHKKQNNNGTIAHIHIAS